MMKRMINSSRLVSAVSTLIVAMSTLALTGCGSVDKASRGAAPSRSGTPTHSGGALTPDDFASLVGPIWVGTLTYLDYTSGAQRTIPANISFRRNETPSGTLAVWRVSTGYSEEPHANTNSVLTLSADGKQLGDERVLSVQRIAPGELNFTTEINEPDDGRAALVRRIYRVTPQSFSKQKLVRFDGTTDWFERHAYRFTTRPGK
jgi:hypothetical protein